MKHIGKNLIKYFKLIALTMLLLPTAMSSLHAVQTSDSFAITFNVDLSTPSKITDLAAVKTMDLGEISLSWQAPGDDDTQGQLPLGAYLIRYDTRTLSEFGGDATNWWNNASNSYIDFGWQPKLPGEDEEKVIDSLANGVTYYFGIRSKDDADKWSDISNIAWAMTKEMILDPITDLIATTDDSVDGGIQLEWTSVGGEGYTLKFATYSAAALGGDTTGWWNVADTYLQGWGAAAKGSLENVSLSVGFTPGATYYISIRAQADSDMSDVGNIEEIVAGDKTPAAPSGLTLAFINNNVKVSWSANSETDLSRYLIYRKESGGSYLEISTVPYGTIEYLDTTVDSNKQYYYRLRAEDNEGNISGYSVEKDIYTGDTTTYADVTYIRVAEVTSSQLTFEWQQVDVNAMGYAIERTLDLTGSWESVGFVYSTSTLRYTVNIEETVYYYRVVTVSLSGNRSSGCRSIEASSDVNHVYMSSDGNAWAMVPYECAVELYPENNNNAVVELILEVQSGSAEGFLLTYNLKAIVDGTVIDNFIFKKTRKGARIVISYKQLLLNKVISSSQVDNMKLALFWYNGVEWIKLGGVSEDSQWRVYTMSRRLGMFGIKYAVLADEFTLTKVVPRIFTPEEGDYRINAVRFYFENPTFEEVTIRIFNVTGAEIISNLRREGENIMVWDGRDNDGSIVRGGLYIYQIEAGGKVLNGTIVIAK